MDCLLLLLLLATIIKLHALIVVALARVAHRPIIINIVINAYLRDFLLRVVIFELRGHSCCVCGCLLLSSSIVTISFLVLLCVARVACGRRTGLRALSSHLLISLSLPILAHHLLMDGW